MTQYLDKYKHCLYISISCLQRAKYNCTKRISPKETRMILDMARKNIEEAVDGYIKFDNDMGIVLNTKQEQINNLKQEIYLLNEQIRTLSN